MTRSGIGTSSTVRSRSAGWISRKTSRPPACGAGIWAPAMPRCCSAWKARFPRRHRAASAYRGLRRDERARRARFGSRLERAADAYLVRRGGGRTIVAGYPWFTDWGRDTFIALRGLCLATGRLDDARSILLEWAGHVSEGMLPNRFADQGAPEYNTVDASLWYVIAVHEYLRALADRGDERPAAERRVLGDAVRRILAGHVRGTRYGIRVDEDGLLAAGEPGVQLTWMDAKVGDWVVTPRVGKPVEIQALWLNALRAAGEFTSDYAGVARAGHPIVPRSLLERAAWVSPRRRGRGPRARANGRHHQAEPDLRGGRIAVPADRRRGGAPGGGSGGAHPLDPAGTSNPGARRGRAIVPGTRAAC